MQRESQQKQGRGVRILSGTAWILGLVLAGSEGPLMPWGNILGLVLFWASCVLMAKQGIRASREKAASRRGKSMADPGRIPARSLVPEHSPLPFRATVGIIPGQGLRA